MKKSILAILLVSFVSTVSASEECSQTMLDKKTALKVIKQDAIVLSRAQTELQYVSSKLLHSAPGESDYVSLQKYVAQLRAEYLTARGILENDQAALAQIDAVLEKVCH